MRQNIKISKREMKEDKFTTFILRAKDYVTENWMYFAGGLAAVIIVVGGISLIQSNRTKQEIQAAEIYNRAMTEYHNGSYQLAITDFKSVVDQYGSTSRAKDAAFNLGNAYFANGSHLEAKEAFENYLAEYSDNEYFVTSAIAGIAASLAGMGQFQEAADKYREAAEKYEDFKMAGQYYLKAMQYYIKAQQPESAKVIFAKITNEFKDTPVYLDAARLAAEHKINL